MNPKENSYKALMQDLFRGQVEGLEEKYHEIKSTQGYFTFDSIQEIILEVEKNYNLSLPNILSYFQLEHIASIRVSQLISKILDYCNDRPKAIISPKPSINPLPKSSILSPKQLRTVEFSSLSFLDFKSRIDLHTDLIVQALPFMLPKRILPELLKSAKIQVNQKELKEYSNEVKKNAGLKLSLSDFRSLLFAWYRKSHAVDLRLKILNTISQFESIREGKLLASEKESVENLLATLRSKLNGIPGSSIKNPSFEEKCTVGLHEIFNFYSKQQFLLGKTPTFDDIRSNTELLTMGKFLSFCKDFKIIDESDKIQEKNSSKMAQSAFVKFSEFGRNMQENHFISAVSWLAQHFFDKEYDKRNKTSWEKNSPNDKKIKFYEFLQCHEPSIYTRKLKGSVKHFGVGSYDRLPENDLSKKYKPRAKVIERGSAEEWNGEDQAQSKRNGKENKEKIKWKDQDEIQSDELVEESGKSSNDDEANLATKKIAAGSPLSIKSSLGSLKLGGKYSEKITNPQNSHRAKSEFS